MTPSSTVQLCFFSIELKDACLCLSIVKHHLCFLPFIWQHKSYECKVLQFDLPSTHRVFTTLITPIVFLSHHKCLHIIIYLDNIQVLMHTKHAGTRAQTFFCSLFTTAFYILFGNTTLSIEGFAIWAEYGP